MKKASQLMNEMGFNPKGAESAKEAFIKYLIKQATGVSVQTPSEKKLEKILIEQNPQKIIYFPKQLEFNFSEAGADEATG